MKCRIIMSTLAIVVVLQGAAFAVTMRDIVFTTRHAGKVVFSHSDHMNRKEMSRNCRACHDAIYDLKKKRHYAMADMEKGRSCGACHNGKKAFDLKECARCHQTREIVYNIKATGPLGFSHKSHLSKTSDCSVCHPSVFSIGANKRFSMADMEKGKSCGACHNGKKSFGLGSCVTCHPFREITYNVKATGPTRFSHNIHIKVSECGACHPALYSPDQKNRRAGMSGMEKGKSCGACHDAKQAFPLKECSKCHPVRDLVFEDKDAGDVIFSHKFHTGLYTCVDCHTSLYEAARSKLKVSMSEMEKGNSCGSCHDGKTAFSVKEKCESCHKM